MAEATSTGIPDSVQTAPMKRPVGRPRIHRFTDDQIQLGKELYEAGVMESEIAERLGVTYQTFNSLKRGNGWARKPPPSLPGEEWRPVIGHEGIYSVSNMGRVRNDKPIGYGAGRILGDRINRYGYNCVILCFRGNRGRKNALVHHLVAAAFIGPRPARMDINHKNGRKADNRVENLEYITSSENHIHALQTGLIRVLKGEEVHNAKLTEENVRDIRRRYAAGENAKSIADSLGIHRRHVWGIATRKTWKHVD